MAAELDITKAALHYHYASKAELGEALIKRYSTRFASALTASEAQHPDAPGRLNAYAELYLEVLRDQRMCLCGMMAAEYETLPQPMQAAVIEFFDHNERWLARVLEQGRRDATLWFSGTPRDQARLVISALEGAMLLARPLGDITRFQTAVTRILNDLMPAYTPIPPTA